MSKWNDCEWWIFIHQDPSDLKYIKTLIKYIIS